MDNIRVAVVGYGNIGRYAIDAINAAEDMTLAGIVRRDKHAAVPDNTVTDTIEDLGHVDVALVCTPTRTVEETALKLLKKGIHTVDSFDIHQQIGTLRHNLGEAAKAHGSVAIVSSGWDPGSDSVVRTLFSAMAPQGITYTNFGPGMSMGHSVAVRAIEGVADAMALTIPLGTGLHRRMVYVALEPGASLKDVSEAIHKDPYFAGDKTHVAAVDELASLLDYGHGVSMTRKGVSSQPHNQLFEFSMRINNPALTAQVMTAAARAAMKQPPGAYTLIEIPLIHLLPGSAEDIIAQLV